MQKNILIATFTVLFLAVVAVFIYIFHLNDATEVFNIFHEDSIERNVKKKVSNNWTDKLAIVNKKDYIFPVNDLYIKIDLKPSKKDMENFYTSYKLVIEDYNRYSLFCLKQVLDLFDLPYIIVSEKNQNNIIIQSKNQNNLVLLTKELQKYDINSKLQEVKYEKNSNM